MCNLSQLCTIFCTIINMLFIDLYTETQACIQALKCPLYLCKVLLYHIIPHLSSIQLSIKSSTDHGHDVINTSHPVLISQQIPTQHTEELLECQTCNLKNITHKHVATIAAIKSVRTILQTFFHASQVHFSLENLKSQWRKL